MTIIQAMGGDATESMVKWLGKSIAIPEEWVEAMPESDLVRRKRIAAEGTSIMYKALGDAFRPLYGAPVPSHKAIARKHRRLRKRV